MSRKNNTQIGGINQTDVGRDAFLKSMLLAEDIMNTDFKTLTMDHSVKACLKFMKVNKVRHVLVIDPPNESYDSSLFIGVVSDRDVLRLNRQMNRHKDPAEEEVNPKALRQKIGQVVARDPKSADVETPIAEVITMMIDNHIDIVPVLSGATLKGIITTMDVLKLFSKLDDAIRIQTDKSIYYANKLIVAIGPWIEQHVPSVKFDVSITRQIMLWFEVEDRYWEYYKNILIIV